MITSSTALEPLLLDFQPSEAACGVVHSRTDQCCDVAPFSSPPAGVTKPSLSVNSPLLIQSSASSPPFVASDIGPYQSCCLAIRLLPAWPASSNVFIFSGHLPPRILSVQYLI